MWLRHTHDVDFDCLVDPKAQNRIGNAIIMRTLATNDIVFAEKFICDQAWDFILIAKEQSDYRGLVLRWVAEGIYERLGICNIMSELPIQTSARFHPSPYLDARASPSGPRSELPCTERTIRLI